MQVILFVISSSNIEHQLFTVILLLFVIIYSSSRNNTYTIVQVDK